MKLKILVEQAEAVIKATKSENNKLCDLIRYRSKGQTSQIDIENLSPAEVDKLYEMAKKDGLSTSRSIVIKINAWRKLAADPAGTKVHKLEALVAALIKYIRPSLHKWLFTDEREDAQVVPWYVVSVRYQPPDIRHGTPARAEITLASVIRGGGTSTTLQLDSNAIKGGKTVVEVLHEHGYYLETEEAVAQYLKDMEVYKRFSPLTGAQFNAFGIGFDSESYGYNVSVEMIRDGEPAKVVMDDLNHGDGDHDNDKEREITAAFWSRKSDDDDDDDDADDDEGLVDIPVQPYVKVFDLLRHQFIKIHTNHLQPYKWDTSLSEKLVLREEIKDLISILVSGAEVQMEDIIKGKTGGVIVIATGPPGTGKTLSAEVFSEAVKKPLYVVQCSQLGTDEETLEKKLEKVLDRSTRWHAILLIDEADVYVHERGNDIMQNAIVGVFLRVLEHYRGILFMTSNRSTIIDDAILSRATAWVRYDKPDAKLLSEIWRVLAAQYKVNLSPAAVGELVAMFPNIAGRDVKNMLKLSRLLAGSKDAPYTLTPKTVKYVSQFLDVGAPKPPLD